MRDDSDNAGVRFPPPAVFLGFLLLGALGGRLVGGIGFGWQTATRVAVGGVLLLLGGALAFPAFAAFRRRGTNPEPWKPATAIVDTGLYRYTRNPMYLGMAIMQLGLAVLIDAPRGALTLPLSLFEIQTQVIAREEAYLARKFGAAYLDCKARVRRWI